MNSRWAGCAFHPAAGPMQIMKLICPMKARAAVPCVRQPEAVQYGKQPLRRQEPETAAAQEQPEKTGEAEGQLMLEKASGEEALERKKTGKIPEVPELEEAGAEMPGLQETGRMLRKLSREEASAA